MVRDIEEIEEKFEEYSDEYGKFNLVENKRSVRKDLHVFIVLDEWFPGNINIISAAEHDEIYLNISYEAICTLTDAQILELCRCGVSYNEEFSSLFMFV